MRGEAKRIYVRTNGPFVYRDAGTRRAALSNPQGACLRACNTDGAGKLGELGSAAHLPRL